MTTLRLIKKGTISETEPIYDYLDVYKLMKFMGREEREKLYVLHLSAKHKVMAKELVSVGTLTQSLICSREVFKGAVLNNSAAIICVHNHPSGDVTPSNEDIGITRRLEAAGDILGIPVLDHVIIGDKAICSIKGYLGKRKSNTARSRIAANKRTLKQVAELRRVGVL